MDAGRGRRRCDASRSARRRARAARPRSPCAAGSTAEPFLGSRSTFTLGRFGGHEGRPLRAGDVLADRRRRRRRRRRRCRRAWRRSSDSTGSIGVLIGPHAAPEFLTADGLDDLLRADVGGALQLGPHRCPPDRPAPAVGPPRRRRRRPAPVEHPRHRLRDRRRRPHRRHAGDPRPRRPEPRRLRLPGRRGRRGALEARPAAPRRPGAARAVVAPRQASRPTRGRAEWLARATDAVEPVARRLERRGARRPARPIGRRCWPSTRRRPTTRRRSPTGGRRPLPARRVRRR